jgi:hypothetical protein
VSYQPGPDGALRLFVKNFEASGDGNLLTSVDDFARWSRFFEQDDALGVKGLSALVLTKGPVPTGGGYDYAMGLRHTPYRGLDMINHSGVLMGFRGVMLYFPERHCFIICLANLSTINPGLLTRRMADVAVFDLDGVAPAPPASKPAVAVSPAELARLAGPYQNVATPTDVVSILSTGTELVLHQPGPAATLSATGAGVFTSAATGTKITFAPSPDQTMTIQSQTRGRRTYRRSSPAVWSPAVMQAIVGEYRSDEIDATFRIDQEKDGLVVRRGSLPAVPVEILAPGLALAGPMRLAFASGPSGRPAGFTLESGRITGLRFVRVPQGASGR